MLKFSREKLVVIELKLLNYKNIEFSHFFSNCALSGQSLSRNHAFFLRVWFFLVFCIQKQRQYNVSLYPYSVLWSELLYLCNPFLDSGPFFTVQKGIASLYNTFGLNHSIQLTPLMPTQLYVHLSLFFTTGKSGYSLTYF